MNILGYIYTIDKSQNDEEFPVELYASILLYAITDARDRREKSRSIEAKEWLLEHGSTILDMLNIAMSYDWYEGWVMQGCPGKFVYIRRNRTVQK
jgi:hypothetical protein